MGIHKATYNQTSKKFLHFSSRKINSSMHRQNKKYLSLYLYKGKIGHLYAQAKQKKTYTSMHNETRGAVCIPASSYCACMYKSLNCPFCISIFIPRPRGCSILTQKNLFVKKFLHVFSLSTVEQFFIREKGNATGISDGVYDYFLQ